MFSKNKNIKNKIFSFLGIFLVLVSVFGAGEARAATDYYSDTISSGGKCEYRIHYQYETSSNFNTDKILGVEVTNTQGRNAKAYIIADKPNHTKNDQAYTDKLGSTLIKNFTATDGNGNVFFGSGFSKDEISSFIQECSIPNLYNLSNANYNASTLTDAQKKILTDYTTSLTQNGTPFYDIPGLVEKKKDEILKNDKLKLAAEQTQSQKSSCSVVSTSYLILPNLNWDCLLAAIANLFLTITSFFLWVAATALNKSITLTMDMQGFLSQYPIVDLGWHVLRDVANMCFIFILLAIGIGTILENGNYNAKKLLANVVIVAVLMNFSLFFTKVVIDTSNILTFQFYNKIVPADGNRENVNNGITAEFLRALHINTVYEASQRGVTLKDVDNKNGETPSTRNIVAIGVGGSVLILGTAFVFITAAILFVIRIIVLIFLMIVSPIAIAAIILPSTKKQFSKWQQQLISQAFFAPIFMMFMYVMFAMITTRAISKVSETGDSFASYMTGNASSVGTLLNYFVLTGFMLASLIVAKSFGATGGDIARNWAGKATFGATAWLNRQGLGKMANWASNTDTMQRWKNKNGLGILRGTANFIDGRAKGTWDLRSTKVGGMAAKEVGGLGEIDGKGGYQKLKSDEKARDTAEKTRIAAAAKTQALENKRKALTAALALTNTDPNRDMEIQTALSQFSETEYKELGASTLSNSDVIRNSTHNQIKASTDEKNDKLNDEQKERISSVRREKLTNAINLSVGTPPDPTLVAARDAAIKDAIDSMDNDDERASIPMSTLMLPEVNRHLNKSVIDKIKMTPAQKTALQNSRATDLKRTIDTAVRSRTAPGTNRVIKNYIKGMGAKDLIDLGVNGLGIPYLQTKIVMHELNTTQLREMIDNPNLNNKDRLEIGLYVANPTNGAVGLSAMRDPSFLARWQ